MQQISPTINVARVMAKTYLVNVRKLMNVFMNLLFLHAEAIQNVTANAVNYNYNQITHLIKCT